MKILVSVDIEGVAGVYHPEQTRAGNPEYERARRLMAAEASAAIAGAFDAGASEVYVNDSHGGFRNMPPDLLDARAQAIQGKPRYLSMVAGVELGVDGLVCIGYHARSKGRGILAHTINSFAFARVRFNGQELGELGIYGLLAGQYGVPVIAASGDDAFIAEYRALLPATRFIEVKRATGFGSGTSLSPEAACAAIRAGVAEAVPQARATAPLAMAGPIVVELQTQTPALADLFCQWPTLARTGGDALRFDAPDVESAVRMLNCLSAMSSVLR
ncbi:M55 family metallopeptidase [Alicycliphilus denitrificans]|uniref:Peptidase M55 D-aminopeptidase n=2 Tax=Alicycliphilus denitrificans TaxID=179636 RepID=F4GCM7_ALIDK|nr:M55 family metallopeptidase [Alicycliphilus denitrificans]ADV02106.1 peptidase M55 D-aminopeptidase [Alicycliphilus denitrificans BC]AEB87035.1 peptidase M55 D-aminopeptidase [Alicycliphilus denitrificans K601]QKD46199.1 M55 family metallopeptidase [Alicycliphilus denitrificans]GAO25704.1 peptidase m55 related protein [Alicycliphilus sp. B1]